MALLGISAMVGKLFGLYPAVAALGFVAGQVMRTPYFVFRVADEKQNGCV